MTQIDSGNISNNFSLATSQLISTTYKGCPDLLRLHSHNTQRYPFLLQSTSSNNKNSRFDILFAFPQQHLVLNNNFELYLDNKKLPNNNFLTALDELWNNEKKINVVEKSVDALPFTGGWFLYLAYELLGQIEPKVNTHKTNNNIAVAVRIPAAIICDRKNNLTHLISETQSDYLTDLKTDFKIFDNELISNKDINTSLEVKEEQESYFTSNVIKAKQYIYDGDIFQSNLSRKWNITNANNIKSISLYKKLRISNPATFSGIIKLDDLTIISSSPERLIRVKDGVIETRPIAGTTLRSKNSNKDTALANKLLKHPKEKAEHIMLIDMERNDLGRVCKAGTVKVDEMMTIETLAHVHHIVSNIKGELKINTSPGDIIKAIFPGGSITGCPKVRCMEIIYELENTARNSYTGSMGYLNKNGDLDLNILIRSIEKSKSNITFRTGAGIVNDSIIECELQETRNKAKGLLAAII